MSSRSLTQSRRAAALAAFAIAGVLASGALAEEHAAPTAHGAAAVEHAAPTAHGAEAAAEEGHKAADIVSDVIAAGDAAHGGAHGSGHEAEANTEHAEAPPPESPEAIARQQAVDAQVEALAPGGGATPDGAGNMATLEPYQLIRSLQFVQDSVVQGDHSAMEMQRFLLNVIDQRLRKADQSVFDKPRNVDAALIYAMSGGNPATLDLLAIKDRFGNFDNEVTTVLRAYLDGRAVRTQTSLDDIFAIYKNTQLGPYIALIAANVKAGMNDDGALDLFDWARLGAPGTIIEEAALRRGMFIAAKKGQVDRSIHYAELYARRFAKSPYAGQFADQLVDLTVEHFDAVGDEGLSQIAGAMDKDREREVYLRIARKAAINGMTELALFAANQAKALSGGADLAPAALAGLYSGLVRVPSDKVQDVNRELSDLESMPLSPRDAALRDAARLIANEIIREPDPNSLTQAFSPNLDTEPASNAALAGGAAEGSGTGVPVKAEPASVKTGADNLPEQAATETSPAEDAEFKTYVEGRSKLIDQIDNLLAGENESKGQ